MNANTLFTRTLFTVLLLSSATVAARPGHGPHGKGPGFWSGERLEFISWKLGLDEGTVAKIKKRVSTFQTEAETLHQQLDALRREKRTLMQAEDTQLEEVLVHIEKMGTIKTELHKKRATMMFEIRSYLTAEQRSTLKAMREQRRAERRSRGHNRGGRRGRGHGRW